MNKAVVAVIVIILTIFGVNLVRSKINSTLPPRQLGNRIQVAASFYPIYFLTKEIGGEIVDVKNITPNGIEPHDYELSIGDQIVIEDSDVVFVNGGVEPWAKKTEKAVDIGTKFMTSNDPHVWLDPLLAIKMAAEIADNLSKTDPENTTTYKSNAAVLIEKLDDLDTEIRNGLASCGQRTFVTSHAAFGYLAKRYSLVQEEISGLSPEDEPTVARMAEVADLVKEKGIKYIFFETLVSDDLAKTIATETGAQVLVFNPLEGLSEAELKGGADYFSVQRSNLENLRKAMDCK